ncbi:MAG TPA: PAS domain S-box protein, partial [Gemmataceae bacterium]|nr:PAS domain S-box protein [Gemmataceae bacterium]
MPLVIAISAIIILVIVLIAVLLFRNVTARERLGAYNRLLLESTGEGIYGIDREGNCTFLNHAGARMLGIRAEEARGKNMHTLAHHSHADGTPYPARECPINQVLRDGRGSRVDDEVFWRADGTSFPVAYTSFPLLQDGQVEGAAVTFTDITEQKRATRRLAVEHAVSTVLAGSTNFAEAAPRLLQDIGEALAWPLGAMWRLDRRGRVLRCTAIWSSSTEGGEFAATTRRTAFKSGEGLPGQVWAEQRAIWRTDLSNEAAFPRAQLAQKEGFRGAIAFPVRRGSEVVGVLEFFTRALEQPDEELVRTVEGLGYQLGQFIERERFEDDLRESETLKSAILQAALDCIITMDHDGKIVEWNAAAEKTFSKARDEVLGHDLADEIIPPAYREKHRQGLQHYLETGEGPILNHRLQLEATRADGSEFPVELTITRIPGNGPPIFTGFIRDITKRKQVEEWLREREEQFRTLADSIPQLAWMTDETGAIVWYNRRWYDYTGQTAEEALGWGWKKVHHPDEMDRVVESLQHSFATGEPWEDTFPLRRHDGEYRWFLSRAVPIRDGRGKVVRWFGTNTDVEDQRRAEQDILQAKEAAETANQAKSQFLANMSHELRTPLNAIIMYSELLMEEAEDLGLKQFAPDLDKIRAAGKHLLALVNGVLDLSKIEAGKVELFLETFDVCGMVKDVVGTVQPLVQKKDNRLEVHCPENVGAMRADLTKLRQVLFNLLSNACKFTEKGTVTLDVERFTEEAGDFFRFRVRDTGIGMKPAQLARLFQPFTQADASTTRKYGGTGLGLAITQRFCELMGGGISVGSELGKGTVFTVRLPAVVGTPVSTPGNLLTPIAAAKVLVIDDDPAVRDFMTRSLTAEAIQVVT